MSNRAEAGITRLDEMAAKITSKFQDIDLKPFMDESIAHRIKSADQYETELLRQLVGENHEEGCPVPFPAMAEKFELRPAEMTVWTGFKGHGKSALLSQVFNLSMTRGQKAFIISPEFKPVKVLERLLIQKLRTRLPTPDELTGWFKWIGNLLWLYDVQSSLKPQDVVALCRFALENFKVDHILVDSLMKCGIAPDDMAGQKKLVDQLQNIAHKYNCHMHLVAHARKGNSDDAPARLHDIKGSSEISDMPENVVSVWRNKNKEKARSMNDNSKENEPDAMMVVEAQRNADGWIGSIPLMFDPRTMLFYQEGMKPDGLDDYVRFV